MKTHLSHPTMWKAICCIYKQPSASLRAVCCVLLLKPSKMINKVHWLAACYISNEMKLFSNKPISTLYTHTHFLLRTAVKSTEEGKVLTHCWSANWLLFPEGRWAAHVLIKDKLQHSERWKTTNSCLINENRLFVRGADDRKTSQRARSPNLLQMAEKLSEPQSAGAPLKAQRHWVIIQASVVSTVYFS